MESTAQSGQKNTQDVGSLGCVCHLNPRGTQPCQWRHDVDFEDLPSPKFYDYILSFFFLKERLKAKQSAHCRKFANYMEVICKYLLPHEHYPEIAGDILMFILLSYLFTIFQNEIIVYIVP